MTGGGWGLEWCARNAREPSNSWFVRNRARYAAGLAKADFDGTDDLTPQGEVFEHLIDALSAEPP